MWSFPRHGLFVAFLLVLGVHRAVFAQDAANFPDRPMRIVVPFAAGGGSSNAARMVGDKLAERWGKSVIIENRPGGNTVIGAEAVARSAANGYTLLFANSSFAINPSLNARLPYDSARDFAPVASILSNPFVLLVNASVPASSLAEFIKLVKAKPADWPFPSVGSSGVGRLAGELFNSLIGVSLVNVPYKGTNPLAIDLLGGQVKYAIEIPGTYLPHVKSGKLRALAVTSRNRLAALPTVPTFGEGGLPELDIQAWYGLMAPAGTPEPIVQKIAQAVQEIVQMPDTLQRIAAIEAEPLPAGPTGFAQMIRQDTERFRVLIRNARIEAD